MPEISEAAKRAMSDIHEAGFIELTDFSVDFDKDPEISCSWTINCNDITERIQTACEEYAAERDNILWVVGKVETRTQTGLVWQYVGVYDTVDAAEEACISPQHFVGPTILNETLPDEIQDWPGGYYPKV